MWVESKCCPRPDPTPPHFDDGARESRLAVISRIGIGVALVVTAAIVFLQFSGALAAASDVALAALVVAIALVVIFAPFFVRLLTSCSSTTTRFSGPACAPSSTGSSTSSATPPPWPTRSR